MSAYVALLRGISPLNPNMRNEKLRTVFDSLGFKNVQTVIASGNVLFSTQMTNRAKLEKNIEDALLEQLGFFSTTIVRSEAEIRALFKKDPFSKRIHSKKTSLNVTFLKEDTNTAISFPYTARGYTILGMYDQSLLSVIDQSGAKTPDVMRFLEKEFGKEITTRTWNTVQKLLKKFDEM